MSGYLEILPHVLILLTRKFGNREGLVSARMRAVRALGEHGNPLSIPFLIRALADRGSIKVFFDVDVPATVRENAVYALAKFGAQAVKPLLAVLNDLDSWTRAGAVQALGIIADPSTDKALGDLLHDPDWYVRQESIKGLTHIRTMQAIQILIGMLEYAESGDRRRVIEALRRIANPLAAEPLARLLENDEDFGVRMDAAEALKGFPGTATTEALRRALKDDVEHVRMKALNTLCIHRATDAIAEALKSRYADISHAAARVLQNTSWLPKDNITMAYFLVGTGQWARAEELGVVAVEPLVAALPACEAALALGRIGDRKAVGPLIAHLNCCVEEDQYAVIEALVKLKDRRAVEPLAAMVSEAQPKVRVWVTQALEKLGDPAAIPGLIRFLLEAPLNEEALQALFSFGPAGIEPMVKEFGEIHRSDIETAFTPDSKQWQGKQVRDLFEYRKFGHH